MKAKFKPNEKMVKLTRSLKRGWNRNSQIILALIAGGSAIVAVATAVKAGPEAIRIKKERSEKLDEATTKLQEGSIDEKTYQKERRDANIEAGKAYILCFGPSASFLTLSLLATAAGYKVSVTKQAAIIGAYKALEVKHDEFVSKAKEIVGEKNVGKIKDGILQDHVNAAKVPDGVKSPEYETDKDGNYIAKQYDAPCWFEWDGHMFMSTRSKIQNAIIRTSNICLMNGVDEVRVSTLIRELDPDRNYLEFTKPQESFGWSVEDLEWDKELNQKVIPYYLTSLLKDDMPMICLEIDPRYLFDK